MEKETPTDQVHQQDNGYWLQKLEAESYQVELVISGVAIYGSLQLLDLMHELIHWVNVNITEELVQIAYFTFVYFLIGVQFLVMSFIAHFALRALWIGMVGLASVYPKGIDFERQDRHSAHYMAQLREEFPSLRGFNQQLDRLCSLVFAFAFGVFLVMLSIGSLLSLFLLLDILVGSFVPVAKGWVAVGLVALLGLGVVLNMALNAKRWWDAPLVRRIHYPLGRFISRMMYLFFRRPSTYLMYTFMTNERMARLGGVYVLTLVVAMVVFATQIGKSGLLLMQKDYFVNYGHRSLKYSYIEYADQVPEDEYIYGPVLHAAEVEGDFLKVFVPTYAREQGAMERLCGTYAEEEGLSRREERYRRDAFWLDCHGQYQEVLIDSVPYPDLRWRFTEHEHREEEGVVAYIPIDSLAYGEHLFTLRQAYFDEKGEKREVNIPFLRVRERGD